MPEIDVNDWLKNTEYTSGYERGDQVIQVIFFFFLNNNDCCILIHKKDFFVVVSLCMCFHRGLFWLKFVELFKTMFLH